MRKKVRDTRKESGVWSSLEEDMFELNIKKVKVPKIKAN